MTTRSTNRPLTWSMTRNLVPSLTTVVLFWTTGNQTNPNDPVKEQEEMQAGEEHLPSESPTGRGRHRSTAGCETPNESPGTVEPGSTISSRLPAGPRTPFRGVGDQHGS
ncbi:hypothetical protein GJAV_G00060630 [Gymnothorax javanicus]|nr:hypothetical protein GJAV_G00060630 [Gymnothorax javanicus]